MKNKGFTGIEILIALAIIGTLSGSVAYVFKDEISARFKKAPKEEVPQTVNNPFPPKPSEEPVVEPKETSVYREEETGKPILPQVTATGEWHGRYNVTYPPECAGESGGWEAFLTETAGRISGNYTTDDGVGGGVAGNRVGENASWSVGGTSGVSFSGNISGHTISGNFSQGLPCYLNDNNERTRGTFFGGRIVQ
jgi:prepilin-type N-terminal cleavage/methylation domain-containing protein